MQTLAPSRPTRRRSVAEDVVVAIVIGFFAALAKRYLDFSLGIPGHAGVGWIAVLIFGRLVNDRPGMATIAGLSMGIWGVPVGLGHSIGYNMALYGMAGALLDSGSMLRLPLSRAWGAMIAGTIVHLAKFGFIFANAWLADMVRRVEIYGLLRALGNHAVFGALGGLVGWSLWRWGPVLHRLVKPALPRSGRHG
jgi:hypothetical protein